MTLLILSVYFPFAALAYDVEVDGIYYNIVSKLKTAEVTFGDKKYTGVVTLPETIIVDKVAYNVTSVGEKAFWYCTSLTSVAIPNSVTKIEANAFHGCKGITSITIPNSVISIGIGAFSLCSSLTSVTIPNSVTYLGGAAFQNF